MSQSTLLLSGVVAHKVRNLGRSGDEEEVGAQVQREKGEESEPNDTRREGTRKGTQCDGLGQCKT